MPQDKSAQSKKRRAKDAKLPVSRQRQPDPEPVGAVLAKARKKARAAKRAAAPAPKGLPEARPTTTVPDFSSDDEDALARVAVRAPAEPAAAEPVPVGADTIPLPSRSVEETDDTPVGGVIVVSRLPSAFTKSALAEYFGQFGTVNRARLAVNRHTGASKHYGFVEFEHRMVAKAVADEMNGYIMDSRRLVVRLMDPEEVHPELFANADRPFRVRRSLLTDKPQIVRQRRNDDKGTKGDEAPLKGAVAKKHREARPSKEERVAARRKAIAEAYGLEVANALM
eukprot:CAMPEP_0170748642 /NCGR_PEP_ID=MMETSP0437-20130122/9975_1 /TAXON_ID=0 /ORGANISM="Sexangularia sp." /LENGTH=281 /DNA_ID=CAMNT_0011087521 /DNA_START=97 /DNA_END=942 /DNA_ORIENTATION=+